MALQNRVLPTGDIVANPARGRFMGNRGILHTPDKILGPSRWRHKAWIICVLSFKGRHSEVMPANRYTRLFFLDEAVALAAGHRPCAECRRADFNVFMSHWRKVNRTPDCRASEVDQILHTERLQPKSRRQQTTRQAIESLPDGTFIRVADNPVSFLVLGDGLYGYAHSHYAKPVTRPPSGEVEALTPISTIDALRSGYRPHYHTDLSRL